MNIKESRKKLTNIREKVLGENSVQKGLSIVIPIFDGIKYIERCLQNLLEQNIDDAKFEVILVFNGKYKEEISFVYEHNLFYENMDMTVLINDKPGAGAARNLGIKFSKYSHIIFLDVDDYFSQDFIQSNYQYLLNDRISLSQIHNITEEGIEGENTINNEILMNAENDQLTYDDVNRILTITACKAIPRNFFRINYFKEYLKSGEDTVLFTELLVNTKPEIFIIPIQENAIYYREVRRDSVSRKVGGFDFLINQRLDILNILDPMLDYVSNTDLKRLIVSKYKAQISFMNKYLKDNLEEHGKVLKLVETQNLNHFDYKVLNRDLADTLVLSYCFAPFSDTSASIVIKRILEEKKIVDVVSNNMAPIRSKDFSFKTAVEPYLSQTKMSNERPSFSNFYYLSRYIDESFEFYSKNIERYNKIYSRAMFPISHFPPLFIKTLNPEVFWKAEFSDPLLIDIESNKRLSEINNEELLKFIKNGILGEFTAFADNNLFNLAEIIPFALADELVFTNENQMYFMIQRFPETIQEKIISKSTISKHPTLEGKYYTLIESDYTLEKEFVNVAYFGNFYSRRDVTELILTKEKLEIESNKIYKFHVFTNLNNLNELQQNLLKDNNIFVNNYVPYFEFLNLANKFDVLLVFDSTTKDIKSLNPYLPSKISDYLGSDSIIIALVEDNSILSEIEDEKLFKLNIENIKNGHFDIHKFTEKVLETKESYIRSENNSLIFPKQDYEISINNSLNLDKVNNYWQTRPSETPISLDKKYEVEIRNISDKNLVLNVKSLYTKRDIIEVDTKVSDIWESICISKFIEGIKYELKPGAIASFTLKYDKEHNKTSFLNAGRLQFSIE